MVRTAKTEEHREKPATCYGISACLHPSRVVRPLPFPVPVHPQKDATRYLLRGVRSFPHWRTSMKRSLLLLAVLAALGSLAVLSTIRAERARS